MKLKKDYGKIAGLTYYVYLVHTPIIGVLQKIFLKAKSEMMGVVSLFILVVIISYGAAIVYKTICDMFYKKVVRRKIV